MIGQMRHQIRIEDETLTSDAYGGATVSARPVLTTVPGAVRPLRADERMRAMQLQMALTHEVTIRYSTDVAALSHKHRLVVDGKRTMNVRAVINKDERNRWLMIMVEEGVPT